MNGSAYGGVTSGPIWLDQMNCDGDEPALGVCGHRSWSLNDCDHSEDAGVVCVPQDCKL